MKRLVQEIVALVFHGCLYNKQSITCLLVDTNFNLLVFKSISHSFAALTSGISTWTLEVKIRIHVQTCNILYIYHDIHLYFPLITQRWSTYIALLEYWIVRFCNNAPRILTNFPIQGRNSQRKAQLVVIHKQRLMFLSLKATKLEYADIPSFFDHALHMIETLRWNSVVSHTMQHITSIGFSIKLTRKGLFLNWSLKVKLVMNWAKCTLAIFYYVHW